MKKTVERWPEQAKISKRNAVKLLISGANRKDVIIALAIEQDEMVQNDEFRIQNMVEMSKIYQEKFFFLKKKWKERKAGLIEQHQQLIMVAKDFL